jgi:hypothetical protein
MVEDGDGVERRAVVVELALVAPDQLAVDHKVPVAAGRAAVGPVRQHARVSEHRAQRLVGESILAVAEQPGVDLLLPR